MTVKIILLWRNQEGSNKGIPYMGIASKIQDSMIKDIRYIFQKEVVNILFNLRKIIWTREIWKIQCKTHKDSEEIKWIVRTR